MYIHFVSPSVQSSFLFCSYFSLVVDADVGSYPAGAQGLFLAMFRSDPLAVLQATTCDTRESSQGHDQHSCMQS